MSIRPEKIIPAAEFSPPIRELAVLLVEVSGTMPALNKFDLCFLTALLPVIARAADSELNRRRPDESRAGGGQ